MAFVIREFISKDIQALMEIWLQANCRAHSFISSSYWEEKYEYVSQELMKAEILVCVVEEQVAGFIGMQNGFIAGLFVRIEKQGQGIGTALLKEACRRHEELSLRVYEKNENAVRFYKKYGFVLRESDTDAETGETEYLMRLRLQSGAV